MALNHVVADRVRAIRRGEIISNTAMTQAELARKIDVNVATLVNIENGRQGATLAFLYKLAQAFNREVADVLPTQAEARAEADSYKTDDLQAVLPEWADLIVSEVQELTRSGGEV